MMIQQLLQFEWRYHRRQTSFWVFLPLFLAYGMLTMISAFQFLEMSSMYNDAYNLSLLAGMISIGTVFPCLFFSLNGLLRDSVNDAEEMIFSTGIRKGHFFVSRFAGVFLMTLLIGSISFLGVYAGTQLAALAPETMHVFKLSHYSWPWLTILLPNVFIISIILFAVTLLSRSAAFAYVAVFAIITIHWLSGFYINSPLSGGASLASSGLLGIATLTDLLGLAAFFEQTQFLTPVEKNDYLLSLSGYFLWNRVLWLTVSSFILVGAYRLFSFRKMKKKSGKKRSVIALSLPSVPYIQVPVSTAGLRPKLLAFISLITVDLLTTLRNIPFLAMIIIWILLLSFSFNYSIQGIEVFGSRYPTTELFLGLILEILPIIGLLLVVFYSADVVWKARSHQFHEIIDSTPVSNDLFYFSKFVVLIIIALVFIAIAIAVGLLFQLFNAYGDFNFGLYLSVFYYGGMQIFLYAAFALFIQSAVANKYLAMLMTGSTLLAFGSFAENLGLEHPLIRFNHLPDMARAYSCFTAYGQYRIAFNWRSMYWLALAVVWILLGCKLWKRGNLTGAKNLLNINWFASEKVLLGSAFAAFLLIGGNIYYQVNVVNDYIAADEEYDFNEHYERKFKQYEDLAVPQLVSVKTQMDIYPSESKYQLIANNQITNTTEEPMREIFVTASMPLDSLFIENTQLVFNDTSFYTYLFTLHTPLLPGDSLAMSYHLSGQSTGFQIDNAIASNGTYIRSYDFSPLLGYVNDYEIKSAYEREQRGLPAREQAIVNDSHLQANSKFNLEKVSFETIISTEEGQHAFSSGKLMEQWVSAGRRYYHYQSAGRITNAVAYFSARYQVEQVDYRGVAIELYYLPQHHQNVAEMIKVTKATIDYCTDNFGPYPHQYLRIGEVPTFVGANGQAMPGVVSINERVFKRDITGSDAFNVVARVLIHEVAHQWWGYILTPKRVEGFMMLGESLAKYSEIVVLDQLYGKALVRQLSEYTLRKYFSGRSYASLPEPSLHLCGSQTYVAYSKGAIVMNAMRELFGEIAVNTALKKLIAEHHQGATATTLDLLESLYAEVPPQYHKLIDDWLKRVVSYDLSIQTANCQQLKNGSYEITINVNAQRFETNASSEKVAIDIDEPIRIGVFTTDPQEHLQQEEMIYLEAHRIHKSETVIKLIVDKKPAYVSIDPNYTRLDRNRQDNELLIEFERFFMKSFGQ